MCRPRAWEKQNQIRCMFVLTFKWDWGNIHTSQQYSRDLPGGTRNEETKMPLYQIENTHSGLVLGVFEAADEADALDVLARDIGYTDYAEAQEVAPAKEGEIAVTEVELDK